MEEPDLFKITAEVIRLYKSGKEPVVQERPAILEQKYYDAMVDLLLIGKPSIPIMRKRLAYRASLAGNVIMLDNRMEELFRSWIVNMNNLNSQAISFARECGAEISNPCPILPENDIDELERVIDEYVSSART